MKTINISDALHKRIKLKAFQEGSKIADYIEALLKLALDKNK